MARITDENRGRRVSGAGFSVLGASKETGIPEKRIRAAIERGEVRLVDFGGTKRLPPSEVQRLSELYE
jgi:hypothetical protein